MKHVISFPHISAAEFVLAGTILAHAFNKLQNASKKGKWLSATWIADASLLRITKELSIAPPAELNRQTPSDPEIEDDDEERLERAEDSTPLVHYDIILSVSYQVPVLYIHVSDPLYRYPPTMDTLNSIIISPQYINQTKDVGILGGITVTDHPILDRPVFFIHPCRTAEMLRASCPGNKISPFEYLLVWIGAIGKTVGLDLPIEVVLQAVETTAQS